MLDLGHLFSHPSVPYWNATVQLVFLIIVTYVLVELRDVLNKEKELARHDSLTGAANARHFAELAETEMGRMRRYGRPFTLGYMDLDNFKAANDSFGHSVGDKLLCATVETISKEIRATDTVARLGGDEFALLLPETGVDAAEATMSKVRGALLETMRANSWPVTFSIGVVTFLEPPQSVDAMLHVCDSEMYAVKRGDKNGIRHIIVGDQAGTPAPD